MALSELLDASDEKYHYIINLTYKTVLAALETGGYEVDYAKFCAKNSAAHGNTANDMESRAILAAVEEFVRAHKLERTNDQRAQWKAVVNDTLKQYGAKLDERGTIVRGEKTTLVRVESKGCRLYFRGASGRQISLMTGPVEPKTVEDFVEKFWFWTKEK